MTTALEAFIAFLQSLPVEANWVLLLLFCYGSLLLLLKLFGRAGAFMYIPVAIIAGNIQLFNPVFPGTYGQIIPLGTILFTSTFLATDILNEVYGKAIAKKAMFMGFAGYLLFSLLMVLTIGFPPLNDAQNDQATVENIANFHDQITMLFQPFPAFFVASMVAFLVSQLFDIWCFDALKQRFFGERLWLRNNASTIISALLDNTVFSVLAWQVFQASGAPVDSETLIYTFILGTYVLRIIIAVLDTPFVYLGTKILVKQQAL